MTDNILIQHKQFEEDLERLINNSELPTFVLTDIMDKATEKLKHMVTVQTIAAIQAIQKEGGNDDKAETQPEPNTRESAAEG